MLRSLALSTCRSGAVRCTFRESGAPRVRLASEPLRHVYRIAQESVSNALHHAAARRITIALRWSPARLVLTIRDDGRGIENARLSGNGLGLRTMRARATALAGTLKVRAARPSGTEVRLSLPLNRNRR
jgi:signal transduction histidine kinase